MIPNQLRWQLDPLPHLLQTEENSSDIFIEFSLKETKSGIFLVNHLFLAQLSFNKRDFKHLFMVNGAVSKIISFSKELSLVGFEHLSDFMKSLVFHDVR